MPENFYVNTVGAVSSTKLSEAMELGKKLTVESKAAGSERASIGTIMTGNNAGDFLLGVTYPSMIEIEATYDAIGTSPVASKIYASLDVNLRTIIRVHAAAT